VAEWGINPAFAAKFFSAGHRQNSAASAGILPATSESFIMIFIGGVSVSALACLI
jgi:hypothetical protein